MAPRPKKRLTLEEQQQAWLQKQDSREGRTKQGEICTCKHTREQHEDSPLVSSKSKYTPKCLRCMCTGFKLQKK